MFLNKVLLIFVFVFLLELQVLTEANRANRRRIIRKPKHPYGSPSNILGFKQIGDDTKVIVDDNALDQILLHPEVKDRKIVVVSVIGAFRKGKSFFMDYCLRFMYANYKSVNFMANPTNNAADWMGGADVPLTGFSWKSGGTRDTTGIIIWSDVFLAINEIGEKLAIVLIDTQGLFDSKTSPADNSRIFALGTLISSIQIFNLNDVIEETQLQYLQLATDFSKLAANDNQRTYTTKPFQKLLFLIRDWGYPDDEPYGFIGGNSYLTKNLKIEKNQHESLRSVREYINSSFEDISCCLLPFPGKPVTRANYDGSWSKMDEDFKDELNILIETLLHQDNLVIKKINNIELTAAELRSYIQVYFRVFQSNDIVGAQSLYEITVTEQMNILIQKELQTYKENLLYSNHTDLSSNFVEELNATHYYSKKIAIDQFNKAQKMGSAIQHLKFRNDLEMKIEETFSEWKVDAVQNHEKLKEKIREIQLKEAENQRLEQDKLRIYKEHQKKIEDILRNNNRLTEQQLEKYNQINNQLKNTHNSILNRKDDQIRNLNTRTLDLEQRLKTASSAQGIYDNFRLGQITY